MDIQNVVAIDVHTHAEVSQRILIRCGGRCKRHRKTISRMRDYDCYHTGRGTSNH